VPDPAVWLAGAALLAVVVLAAASLPWRSASSSLDFPDPVLGVAVELTAGEVLVRGDDDVRGARLRRSARFGLRRPRVHEEIDDDRVLRLRAVGSLRYELLVPSAVPVEVRVNRGSASVVALRGPVSLRTGAGSVDGRALESRSVTAETASGSVRLWFDRQPSAVDVRTREGEVDLRLPGGPYDVEAAAGSDGDDCTVAVPVEKGAPCRVRARSAGGGIRIRQR
jgi:hypothetical protein